jgi:tRNA A37 methylthiotransferase MiaB
VIGVAPGARVHLHQAFRCCPYAGTVSSQIHEYLEQNGYTLVADPKDADVQVVNTCGSDARQAALTWHVLEAVRVHRPDAAVVVTGCLVSIEPAALAEALAPFARAARFDPRHLPGLDTVFQPAVVPFDAVQPALRSEYTGNDFSEGWAHVLASTGCLGTCSFCAIRRATGRPKSRTIDAVRADITRSVDAGVRDVLLISTDLSAWGTDRGETVVDLLRAVAEMPGDFLVSGESFEPTLFLTHFDALLPILASGRFAFVGLPIQSGSARVLRRMDRSYDPADVLAAVARLKAAAPDLLVRTDLLYGFADETDAEFEESVAASRAFDLPSFNAYQPRPGTAPVELPLAVVSARRDRAFEEMRTRAQAGLPQLRRWAGTVDARAGADPQGRATAWGEGRAPRDGSGATSPAQGGPAVETAGPARGSDPWDLPDGQAWIADQARRFAAVLGRRGGLPLGDGWEVAGARAEADAVVLDVRGAAGAIAAIGLRPAAWPGAALARTGRYAVWVRTLASGSADPGAETPASADLGADRPVAAVGDPGERTPCSPDRVAVRVPDRVLARLVDALGGAVPRG